MKSQERKQTNNQLFYREVFFKGAPLCLRQFLTTESSLKMMKKCFLFYLKRCFCSQDI